MGLVVNRRWTNEEIYQLKELNRLGYSDTEIADSLSRPRTGVSKKRRNLGLPNHNRTDWSDKEEKELKKLVDLKKTDDEIAEIMNRSKPSITRKRFRLGIQNPGDYSGTKSGMYGKNHSEEARRKMSEAERPTREKHHGWKGGKSKNRNYNIVKNPSHHRANKNGYVFEHVVIAEEKYGFEIKWEEWEIHHVDHNKNNNHPDNLLLIRRDAHKKYHQIAKRLEEK